MWVTRRKLIYSNVSVNKQLYLRWENKIVVLEIENRKCLCLFIVCILYRLYYYYRYITRIEKYFMLSLIIKQL